MGSLKNRILKGITWLDVFSLLYFTCCLDAESLVPCGICCVNILWLVLFGYANNWFEESED